jgi:hypothetical protein
MGEDRGMKKPSPTYDPPRPEPLPGCEQLPESAVQQHHGPSEAATADIEKRRKPQRQAAECGRHPEDAPTY